MTELRVFAGRAGSPALNMRIEGWLGLVVAGVLLAAGTSVVSGLLSAPQLVDDLSRSADRLALRQSVLRGQEALESVRRRQERLAQQLEHDELFIARLCLVAGLEVPDGFFPAAQAGEVTSPFQLDLRILRLERRMRNLENVRRRLAALPSRDWETVPSRSPVEPSSAVPVTVFGKRISPLTHRPEFYPGLLLAVPKGAVVFAPAAGTIVYSGPAPSDEGPRWRQLGYVIAIDHGGGVRTVIGSLARPGLKRKQKVIRGQAIGTAVAPEIEPGTRVYYEVHVTRGGRLVPVDPRISIFDALWISPQELRNRPSPPPDAALPPVLR
ncbi:MAG: M23 family metallopeptidase [Thermoanaerobaculia bacterium]|nr:hypothetical protein [Thermoanaerobaculia bacterium]MCK6684167.1 M23 family metallopeptidase [Thermoanaerobaculia bacterium]